MNNRQKCSQFGRKNIQKHLCIKHEKDLFPKIVKENITLGNLQNLSVSGILFSTPYYSE